MPQNPKKIGLLLVHGMGEQQRGQHARRVVRSFLASWESLADVQDVVVRSPGQSGCGSTCRPAQPTSPKAGSITPCSCRDSAPFVIRLALKNRPLEVHCHEVWWADLGQRTGIRHWARFWRWAICTPFRPPHRKPPSQAEQRRHKQWCIAAPQSHRRRLLCLIQRLLLFCLVVLTFLLTLTWGLLRRAFRKLAPSRVLLLQTLGDVAMFHESGGLDTGTEIDLGLPPRFAIRRRMVREMVAMAERSYDQWYIMGHSLGSVLAFNGLMEPDYVLPNYLAESHWNRLKPIFRSAGPIGSLASMRPRRPSWLGSTDAISRKALFCRLGGFVTYGSPLHLFCDLWPRTVAINNMPAFSSTFRWINIHSPFDVFAGSLKMYEGFANRIKCNFRSYVYTGSTRAFIAHSRYLRPKKRRKEDLARALGKWMLLGNRFGLYEVGSTVNRVFLIGQILVVCVVAFLGALLELALLGYVLDAVNIAEYVAGLWDPCGLFGCLFRIACECQ